jgi:formylmethanofuran dehydrogenase subunit C
MSIKVSPLVGGLGIDATDKFIVQSNATATVGNGTTTGNVHIGGNVGIGTDSPGTNKLSVNGDLNVSGTFDLGSL